jgi:60 kDa SS-A/Ro ribonucleoprotein
MNLKTLMRHGVLADDGMVSYVAGRMADPDEVRRSRQFPYQYFAAYLNAGEEVPGVIREALGSAAETACGNVPQLPGPVVIGLDVSGSMGCPVTGARGRGQASKMRCVDVAALFAAAVLRRNPDSVVLPFDTQVHHAEVTPGEGILSLAARLSRYGGGGTNCSLPIAEAAEGRYRERSFAGCVLVSDNESWVGEGRYGATAVLSAWQRFVANQARLGQLAKDVRLVCIDLQPHTTVQAPDRGDVLNVGGFSDAVFEVVNGFLRQAGHDFVAEVEAVEV